MSADQHFSIRDPLPRGVFSVAASAGTGKTYTLAGLATRFLAEGTVTAGELLMVTFTRAATGELRARVRDRVVEAAEHLRVVAGGGSPERPDDELLDWLASAGNPAGDVAERLGHLERAIVEFDGATITTIHGFAAQVLGSLGVGAGVDPGMDLAADLEERITEVCSDLMARAAIDPAVTAELPSWDTFVGRTRHAAGMPGLVVTPSEGDEEAGADHALLASLVRDAVGLLADRRRAAGTQSFDDLLVRLRGVLADSDPATAAAATGALRRRFGVALIDEFQDTDPVQWEIFATLFTDADGMSNGVDGDTALVLVGDPKQAIYSFRGADVHTYLDAVERTPGVQRRVLGTNWRADDGVVAATDALFRGTVFGDGIPFVPVTAAEHHVGRRLLRHDEVVGVRSADDPGATVPSLAVRLLDDPSLPTVRDGTPASGAARDAVFDDLVRHAVDLLERASMPDDTPGVPDGVRRPVRPADIAVLVRSNKDAQTTQDRLRAHGVPAVLARGASVLDSPAADHLTWLLEALVAPADQRRVRTFAISWFGGHDAGWVADADEARLSALAERLQDWESVLTSKGVVELFRTVWRDTSVVPRVLAGADGDRHVTDLEHLGELLRMEVGDAAVSPGGLLAALEDLRRGQEAVEDTERDTDVTSRRVESDAEAVQIMTVWVAKGLEFPVVLCPTLWTTNSPAVEYHDPGSGRRTFDVRTKSGGAPKEAVALAEAEHAAEERRLLYVAMTRAVHHTALWWADVGRARSNPVGEILFRGPEDDSSDPSGEGDPAAPGDTAAGAEADLAPLVARGRGHVAVRRITDARAEIPDWSDPSDPGREGDLAAATFVRPQGAELDRSRARWSFSAVVSRDRTQGDPWDLSIDDEGADDEQRPPDVGLDPEGPPAAAPATEAAAEPGETPGGPLAWLPAGAAFGTLAHDVLERVDFTEADLRAHIAEVVAHQQRWRSLSLRRVGDVRRADDPEAQAEGAALLTEGLSRVVETPLGPLFADDAVSQRRLADVAPSDRLDELAFEMPLGGAGPPATDRRVGEVLADHLEAGDPFRPWAGLLARGAFDVSLAGHLTGSIDAVIRLPGHRFVVVDYKSNRLHPHGVAPLPGDYGHTAMVRAMVEHHYPLQALIYQVALHRYLRWRLPGYDPATHLAGAAYLFLRGMTGPGVPTLDGTLLADGGTPEGVCAWTPPAGAVEAVSDLLAGEVAGRPGAGSGSGGDRRRSGS